MEGNIPLVTVVTCSYNNLDHIYETIDSVLSQTYQRIEYIISDDGSTDFPSAQIISYLKSNAGNTISTHVIANKQNMGTVKNINGAYKSGTGDYYINLSCGDVFYSQDTIEKIVKRFILSDCDVLVTSRILYQENFNAICYLPHIVEREKICKLQSGREQYKALITRRFYDMASGSSMHFSKKIIAQLGYFDERYILWEDGPFLAKYLQNNKLETAYDIVSIWYEDGGISHTNEKKKINPLMVKDAILFNSTDRIKLINSFSLFERRNIIFGNLQFAYRESPLRYLIYLLYLPEYISARKYSKERLQNLQEDKIRISIMKNEERK